jgi:hypothetical protein
MHVEIRAVTVIHEQAALRHFHACSPPSESLLHEAHSTHIRTPLGLLYRGAHEFYFTSLELKGQLLTGLATRSW